MTPVHELIYEALREPYFIEKGSKGDFEIGLKELMPILRSQFSEEEITQSIIAMNNLFRMRPFNPIDKYLVIPVGFFEYFRNRR